MLLRLFRIIVSLCFLWPLLVTKPGAADQSAFSPWTLNLLSEYAYRNDVDAYCSAVVAQIAQNPANVEAITAEAIARAPQYREAIIAANTRAYPGFASRIGRAGSSEMPITRPAGQVLSRVSIASDEDARWSGEVTLGGSRSTGNTDRDQASGTLKLNYIRNLWSNEAKLNFDYARKDDETSARRIVSSMETRYGPRGSFYGFAFVQYEDDKFSGFDFEITESAGLGYGLIDTEIVTWSLEVGPGGRQSVVSETSKTESEIVGRANSEFAWNISSTAKFTNDTTMTTGNDRTTTENTTALSTTIIGELSGRISFQIRHNSSPVAETKSTDTLSKISLAYQF